MSSVVNPVSLKYIGVVNFEWPFFIKDLWLWTIMNQHQCKTALEKTFWIVYGANYLDLYASDILWSSISKYQYNKCRLFLKKKPKTIWVLSQFEFGHNLSIVLWVLRFWVLSRFEFLSFVTIRVFELCNNLSFWVLS